MTRKLRMTPLLMAGSVVCGALVLTGGAQLVSTQGPQTPDALLGAAIHQDDAEGNLDAAIAGYKTFLARYGDHRSLAVQALLRMGHAYERLGRPDARDAYERVLREYAEQAEQVGVARTRLAALATGDTEAVTAGPSLSLVLNEAIVSSQHIWGTSHDFSPSGDQIVFMARWDLLEPDRARRGPGAMIGTEYIDLYLADRAGTLIRPLLTDWGPLAELGAPPDRRGHVMWVDHLRWSPDGRWIAFKASRPSEAYRNRVAEITGEAYENALFVVSAEGGSPRQVGPAVTRGQGNGPYDLWWTPDSEHLAYRTREAVYTITLDGRETAVVEMPASGNSLDMRLGSIASPDGRWIALSEGTSNVEASFAVRPATGGRIIRQGQLLRAEGPGLDTELASALRPAWSRDGRALYAVSDASGTLNIWKFPFDPETGEPAGEPEQVTFYTEGAALAPRILTGSGGLAFTVVQQRDTIQVADAERHDTPRTVARGRNPKLSPAGETIYYIGQGPGQEGIWAVPRAGGTPRRLTTARIPELPYYQDGYDLSPDGTMVVFRTEDEAGLRLDVLSTAGGEPRAIHEFAAVGDVGSPFFSPDGSVVAFTEGNGLYVMPPSGGEPTELAHLWAWESYSVRWSPDGRSLALLGWELPDSEGNSIFLVPASGGEMRRLTTPKRKTGRPEEESYFEGLEWHPDGQRLVTFDTGPGGSKRVVSVDLSGNVSPPLFDHVDGWEYMGRWAPDGNNYFFKSKVPLTNVCTENRFSRTVTP